MRYLVIVVLLFVILAPGYAADKPVKHNVTFSDTSENANAVQSYSPTIKLGSLDSTWLRFTPGAGESGMGGYIQAIAGMFGGAQGKYYTKLHTIQLGGETYLVAYGLKGKPFDPSMLKNPEPPTPEKLTVDSILTLSLIHLKTAGNLTDIHPFNLDEEIAAIQPTETPLPNSVEEARDKAKDKVLETESLSNLKQLAIGLIMYAQDWDDNLPPMSNMDTAKKHIYPYLQKDSVFLNPITKQPYKVNSMLSKHRLTQIKYPASMVVFYEDSPAADETRGVAMLDGTAKRVTETQWTRLKKASKIK